MVWKRLLEPIANDWAKGVPDGAKALDAFRAEVAADTRREIENSSGTLGR